MVQVPEGTAVSTQGQYYAQLKEVMLTKDAPLSSFLAELQYNQCTTSFCKLDNFSLLGLASLKTLLA